MSSTLGFVETRAMGEQHIWEASRVFLGVFFAFFWVFWVAILMRYLWLTMGFFFQQKDLVVPIGIHTLWAGCQSH